MGGTPSSTRWQRYARAFDEISAEADGHYSVRAFVRCVRLEVTVPRDLERREARRRRELAGEVA